MKAKAFFLITSFLFFALPLFSAYSGSENKESDPTFPKEEAGITSYTKLENVDSENNQKVLTKINDFLANKGTVKETESGKYVMGTLKIKIKNKDEEVIFSVHPKIYADAEGWLAAYFPKDAPASKIIQWSGYSPEEGLKTNVLKEAITKIAGHLEKDYDSPRYYHFDHPEANRLTVVIDTAYTPEKEDSSFAETNFSITLPGEGIGEASYSLYYSRKLSSSQQCSVELLVGEKFIHEKGWSSWCVGDKFIYDTFSKNGDTPFSPGNQHTVTFRGKKGGTADIKFRVGSVFIYSEDE